MRWLVLFALVFAPAMSVAGPRIAVAPLDGDRDARVASVVVELARGQGKVVTPERVRRTTGLEDAARITPAAARRLAEALGVDVVVYGTVTRQGSRRALDLSFVGRARARGRLVVEFGSIKELREELSGAFERRIEDADGLGDGRRSPLPRDDGASPRRADDSAPPRRDDDDRSSPFQRGDDAPSRRPDDDAPPRRADDDAPSGRADDDAPPRRADGDRGSPFQRGGDAPPRRSNDGAPPRRADDDRGSPFQRGRDADPADPDDERARTRPREPGQPRAGRDDARARSRRAGASEGDPEDVSGDDDVPAPRRRRERATDAALRERAPASSRRRRRANARQELAERDLSNDDALGIDTGALVVRRTLTYAATGAMQPPRVGTAAAAGRLAAEVYPVAWSSPDSGLARLGLTLSIERAFGLGIDVPGKTVTAPIASGRYALGARYRIPLGQTSIALGLGYWRRYYVADRAGLMAPDDLDMPDVDYAAIAGSVAIRHRLTPTVSAFGAIDVPMMLSSGPIQESASYGSARIVAFGVRAGVQIALARHYALLLAADLDQVALSFTQRAGSLAAARGVTAATDRSLGFAATLGVTY